MRSYPSAVCLQLTHPAAGGKQFRLAFVLLFSVTCAYCSGASTSETIGPTSLKCQTEVIGVPTSMSALGGRIEALVRTSPECAWSATTNATWLQVQPPSGQGEVAVTLQVAENQLPNERIGAIHVNGLDVMLAQAAFVPPPPPPPPISTPAPPAPTPTPAPPAPTPTPVPPAPTPTPTPTPPTPAPTPTPPPSLQQFSGTVSSLTGTCPVLSFTFGDLLVHTDNGTDFIQGNCKHLSNGMDIGVTGTLTGGTVYATQVQLKGR